MIELMLISNIDITGHRFKKGQASVSQPGTICCPHCYGKYNGCLEVSLSFFNCSVSSNVAILDKYSIIMATLRGWNFCFVKGLKVFLDLVCLQVAAHGLDYCSPVLSQTTRDTVF